MTTILHFYHLTPTVKVNFFPKMVSIVLWKRCATEEACFSMTYHYIWFLWLSFLSDYQRMRLFGGQNRSIIFSRTNVSDHFLFFNREQSLPLCPVHSASTKWHQPPITTLALSCSLFPILFFTPPPKSMSIFSPLNSSIGALISGLWGVRTLHSPPQTSCAMSLEVFEAACVCEAHSLQLQLFPCGLIQKAFHRLGWLELFSTLQPVDLESTFQDLFM